MKSAINVIDRQNW